MTDKNRASADSWRTKPLPAQHKVLTLDGRYTPAEYAKIRRGFIPRPPNDKWFLYLEGDWLHVHRSSSGSCIFQLQLLPDGDGVAAAELHVNQDPQQFRSTNDEYNVALVSYLIDTLLLGRFAPFPRAPQFRDADQQRHQQHVMGRPSGGISLKMANGKPRPKK